MDESEINGGKNLGVQVIGIFFNDLIAFTNEAINWPSFPQLLKDMNQINWGQGLKPRICLFP